MSENSLINGAMRSKATVTVTESMHIRALARGNNRDLCEAYARLAPMFPRIAEVATNKLPFWLRLFAGPILSTLLSVMGSYFQTICEPNSERNPQ